MIGMHVLVISSWFYKLKDQGYFITQKRKTNIIL
jgi:hypothetical protein